MYTKVINDPKIIANMNSDEKLKRCRSKIYEGVIKYRYTYNFLWLGLPIIQFPQDIVAIQELIWNVKPDLIIETGIAHGGSLMLSASLLELIGEDGMVVGVDIEIRKNNRKVIEAHPLFKRIELIEGSSTDENVVDRVKDISKTKKKSMVLLDSNHTYEHVRKELELYSSFVSKDSYLVVFDTIIEDLPDKFFNNRPWGKGNNPKTAVRDFLEHNNRFEIDKDFEKKLFFTVAPNGYLRCIKD